MPIRLSRFNILSRFLGKDSASVKHLSAQLGAATRREAELHRCLHQVKEQHRAASEQHRQAVEQYQHAANQLHHAADQLHHAQEQLRHSNAERERVAHETPNAERGPSIFISTLPKSGSIYLLNVFGSGLGYVPYNVSLGYFPRDLLDWQRLRTASGGGAVSQAHLDASPANMQILRLIQPRVQVHLRDPRQATLSMTHHLRRIWEQSGDLGMALAVQPCPPRDFFDRPLEGQIGWMIDNYLPNCVEWIEEWLRVNDDTQSGVNVLLTTFEEFIRDERAFLHRTLGHFGIPAEKFVPPKPEKAMTVHFRQGTPDEWRHVFTPAQQEKARELIPVEWKDRFGWGG